MSGEDRAGEILIDPDAQPLYAVVVQDCYVSRWEPTPDELAILMEGGSVELWVVGMQPPVHIRAVPHAAADPSSEVE